MRMGHQLPPYPIKLKAVAERLGLSQRALGRAATLSAAAVNALLNHNVWPAKANRTQIKADLRDAIHKAGAQPIDLTQAFEPVAQIQPAPPPMQKAKPPAPGKAKAASHPPTRERKEGKPMLPKQSLTRAAMKHFELFNNPFDGEVTSNDEMFTSKDIMYVREVCMQAALHGRFVAVIGESGAGKTTLLADLEERILAEGKKVIIAKPSVLGMEESEKTGKTLKQGAIMDALIYTVDETAKPKQAMEPKTRQLQALLTASHGVGFAHLVVIEEAHALPTNTLRHLKRLLEMRHGRKQLAGVLLIAQPELKKKLNPSNYALREVFQRCEIVELPALNGDLRIYLQVRLKREDKKIEDVFVNDQAVDAIYTKLTVSMRNPNSHKKITPEQRQMRSLVYPLAVNNLMTAAMNNAAALGVPKVTAELILAV